MVLKEFLFIFIYFTGLKQFAFAEIVRDCELKTF